jgi:hypothetical protein
VVGGRREERAHGTQWSWKTWPDLALLTVCWALGIRFIPLDSHNNPMRAGRSLPFPGEKGGLSESSHQFSQPMQVVGLRHQGDVHSDSHYSSKEPKQTPSGKQWACDLCQDDQREASAIYTSRIFSYAFHLQAEARGFKTHRNSWAWWWMSIIPATQEVQEGESWVWG